MLIAGLLKATSALNYWSIYRVPGSLHSKMHSAAWHFNCHGQDLTTSKENEPGETMSLLAQVLEWYTRGDMTWMASRTTEMRTEVSLAFATCSLLSLTRRCCLPNKGTLFKNSSNIHYECSSSSTLWCFYRPNRCHKIWKKIIIIFTPFLLIPNFSI